LLPRQHPSANMVQVLCPQIQKLISALRSKEACVAVSERIPSGDLTYLLKMAIEIYWNYPLKTVIFHSHVNVYQRISNEGSAISILPQAWRLTGVAEAAAAVSDCIIEPSRLCSTGTTGPSPRKIHPSQSEMGLAWLSVMSAPQNSHICWGFFMVFLPCTLKKNPSAPWAQMHQGVSRFHKTPGTSLGLAFVCDDD